MSRSHVRARKEMPRGKRNWLTEAAVAIFLAGLMVWFVMGRMPRSPWWGVNDSAWGTILETRIVNDGNFESEHGEYILYRIEAHVQYQVDGELRDRWIPASDTLTDRASLQLLLAGQPKTCLVTWTPHHEDHAHCVLH